MNGEGNMATTTNDERINLRLNSALKQLIERAAGFKGQSVSKFILGSALARAEETIYEHEVMSLGVAESEAFYNALSTSPEVNEKLTDAIMEYEHRVKPK